MTWRAPFTAVAGSILTAAQVNTFIRDNLNETMPARAATPGSLFVTSGTGEIAERILVEAEDTDPADITSTSFDNPNTGSPGPAVTAVTGTRALVGYRANLRILSDTARIEMSYSVSGASEIEASTTRSVGYSLSNSVGGYQHRMGVVDMATELEPGTNVFTLKYNVSSGTGTADDRRLWVLPL